MFATKSSDDWRKVDRIEEPSQLLYAGLGWDGWRPFCIEPENQRVLRDMANGKRADVACFPSDPNPFWLAIYGLDLQFFKTEQDVLDFANSYVEQNGGMVVKCPYCTKPGEKHLVVSNPGGASWVLCHTCGGTNEIPDEKGRRMAIAHDLRNARVGIHLSLREYAKVLQVSPTTLSHVEVGYLPTPEHLTLWNKMTGESLTEVDR